MAEKVFKTHSELIDLLSQRGMVFSSPRSKGIAKKTLQREGYYNLINGYKDMFLTSSDAENFLPGTTIEEFVALYNFDRDLREIFLKRILKVETNVKSLIAYTFPQRYGHKNYLIYTNFETSIKNASRQVTSLISDIQRQIANRVNDPSIKHYLSTHGYIPLWVVNNILTLGTVSKFYSLMKQNDKQQVSIVFKVSEKELESCLFYLSKIRNFCAHGNRLYCYRSQTPLIDLPAHSSAQIPKSQGEEYLYGKRDLFASLIALRTLIAKNDFAEMKKDIKKAIRKLSRCLKVIDESKVLDKMGFPADWERRL